MLEFTGVWYAIASNFIQSMIVASRGVVVTTHASSVQERLTIFLSLFTLASLPVCGLAGAAAYTQNQADERRAADKKKLLAA